MAILPSLDGILVGKAFMVASASNPLFALALVMLKDVMTNLMKQHFVEHELLQGVAWP